MHRLNVANIAVEQHRQILEPWGAALDAEISRLEETLVKTRRHLHAYPEPSGEERETTGFLASRLEEAGLEVRIGRGGLGIIADLTIGTPRPETPLIALRCDMDALRMPDEKDVEYASRNPLANHACGHDAHATIVLGAALAASRLAEGQRRSGTELSGGVGLRLRFVFQPAEETSQGAAWMVEQGAVDGVAAILALHVDPERLVGRVGLRYGVLTANCDEVKLLVAGHGGHAARPHHTVDPLATSAQLINVLYQYLPRSVDSRSASVFTIGHINGGYASNVIPERVELNGSMRTTDPKDRETLIQRIQSICNGLEEVSGAKIRLRFGEPLRAVNNDPQVTAALEEAARAVVGAENIALIDRPSMGGEDFSVYLDKVPGAMFRLGCGTPGEDKAPFLHSTVFDIDEKALGLGARILLRAALLLSVTVSSERGGD